MLRSRLIWRMVAPVLLLSLLLLIVGGGAALYVHVTNAEVSESLHRCLTAVGDGQTLVFAVRDARLEIGEFGDTGDSQHLAAARAYRDKITAALQRIRAELGDQAGTLPDQIALAQERFFNALESQGGPPVEEAARWSSQLTRDVLDPSFDLLTQCRSLAETDSERNRVMANWVGIGLFVLGLCGAAAGLLAGHGIARAVTRSLEQLGGSVREMAGTLDEQLEGPRHLGAVPDLPDLHSTMQRLADKTATVVQQLQETREHAERSGHLAAIGQFAAGLAHELRNPLTSIKLLVQAAEERQAGLAGRDLEVLEEEIERLETLLQGFLDFARPPSLQKQAVDVWELIQQTADFARRRGAQNEVQILCDMTDDGTILQADIQQLRQVLLNLLLNAIDAQPDGGVVSVGFRSLDSAERPEVVIEIADQGPGLPTELGERIFEPFVSTKETGMGLGLSVCRRIVESHDGSIEAGNGPEGGAVFRVHLPVRAR